MTPPFATFVPGGRLVLVIWVWLTLAGAFVVMAVLASFYDYFPGDRSISEAVQAIDAPVVGGFFDLLNVIGRPEGYLPITLAIAAALALRRARGAALLVLLTVPARAIDILAKEIVQRPRPSPELVDVVRDVAGYGFPSGHAFGTTVLFAVLFVVAAQVVRAGYLRVLLQLACVLFIAAAGPARVYIGVHWPSDVVGGYLLALLVLIPCVLFTRSTRMLD